MIHVVTLGDWTQKTGEKVHMLALQLWPDLLKVMEKLGLHDVTHLVRFAMRLGLLPES